MFPFAHVGVLTPPDDGGRDQIMLTTDVAQLKRMYGNRSSTSTVPRPGAKEFSVYDPERLSAPSSWHRRGGSPQRRGVRRPARALAGTTASREQARPGDRRRRLCVDLPGSGLTKAGRKSRLKPLRC
jgi:hypothetical protein